MQSQDEIIQTVENICDIIENGNSLRYALKELGVNSRYFYEWIDKNTELHKQYARACELRAEAMADEIIEISDDDNADIDIVDGRIIVKGEAIQRSKLKVDTRKWLMAKMNPKKYGDKPELEQEDNKTPKPLEIIIKKTKDE